MLGLLLWHTGFFYLQRCRLLFIVTQELLVVVASLVAEHRFQSRGSVVVGHGLSCPEARGILVFRPGITRIGRQILNQWTTREVHNQDFF